METVEISFAPKLHRFEAYIDGKLVGILRYMTKDNVMSLVHTEVDPDYGGQGVGNKLVQFAFDQARESEDTLINPVCPFASAWVKKNPSYQNIVVG